MNWLVILIGILAAMAIFEHLYYNHKGLLVFMGMIVTCMLWFVLGLKTIAIIMGIITISILLSDTGAGNLIDAASKTAQEEIWEREKKEEDEIDRLDEWVRLGNADYLNESEKLKLERQSGRSRLSHETEEWVRKNRL